MFLTNQVQMRQRVVVVNNARSLQLVCARVLHEPLLVPVLIYGSETMIWKKKER